MKRLDLTSQKFNQLTAVRFDHVKNKRDSMWLFVCDCGKETIACAAQVKAGGTKSCGCRIHNTHPGYNVLPGDEASFRELFGSYKYFAKQRGIEFSLSEERFREITKTRCKYCGSPPLQINLSTNAIIPYIYNGIDRVNSDEDYTEENVVPCCKQCNYAKHLLTTLQFQEWIDRLVKFQNRERDAKASEQD